MLSFRDAAPKFSSENFVPNFMWTCCFLDKQRPHTVTLPKSTAITRVPQKGRVISLTSALISVVSVGAMGSFNVTWPLSFTYVICDLPLEAHCQKKKTWFLSFIPSTSSLPSEVKGTLWRSCLCYFILFFFLLPYHPLSFSSLSLPSPSFIASSLRPANDRDFTGCQSLVTIRPLALFVWPKRVSD